MLEEWKAGALAGIVIVVLGVVSALAISRANLKAELAKAQGDIALCRNVNDDWARSTAIANDAIEKWRDDAAVRSRDSAKAEAAAAKVSAKHEKAAGTIGNYKQNGDDCRAVKAMLDDYARRAR